MTFIPARAAIGRQQEHFRAVITAGAQHHALRDTEAHLARLEIGDHDHLAADECGRVVGGADAREHVALLGAEIERELQ